MKILSFDAWLIENVYQRIVNAVQKEPRWCIEQCGFVLFITSGARIILEPITPGLIISVIVGMMISAIAFLNSRNEYMRSIVAQKTLLRVTVMLLGSFSILMEILSKESLALKLDWSLYQLAFISMYYFAPCKSPPPPKPRKKLALAFNKGT